MSEKSKEELEKKLEECEKKLEEMERLKMVEQSVIAGLREGGFSEKAIKLFRYRKNFLIQDPSEYEADAVGSFTGSCGDHIDTYLKIEGNVIKDAKYRTDGCPGAVTSGSALTELAIGRTMEEARKLSVKSVVEYLKEGPRGLPKNMYDCCGMAIGALRDAIDKKIIIHFS
ncbi:MAG: iron-sulfur cluster assembly scaffold protein [Candidatus Latescibacteria bacterium]|nr:iron-sulfur cluster assembly scaffold protein [Candidatus Latescibacterota bacterium]